MTARKEKPLQVVNRNAIELRNEGNVRHNVSDALGMQPIA